jgi:hypothetical protein
MNRFAVGAVLSGVRAAVLFEFGIFHRCIRHLTASAGGGNLTLRTIVPLYVWHDDLKFAADRGLLSKMVSDA